MDESCVSDPQAPSSPQSGHHTRVLFLSGLQIHPTTSGGTLRSFALVSSLRRRGFDVRVHSLTGRKPGYLARLPSSTQAWPGGTEEYVDRSVRSAVSWLASYVLGLPPLWMTAHLAAAAHSPREILLPPLLREELSWCDAIVADFPFLHPILSAPSARGKLRILSTHNVEHHLCGDQRRIRHRLVRGLVRRVEIRAAGRCDILVVCCASDAEFFAANARVGRVVVVPNGVNVERFRGIEKERAETRRQLGIADDERVALFTASKWGPNQEALDYLLGFARDNARLLTGEKIHILVVGNVAARRIKLPGFTATGRVERVEPYFAAADAALNPIVSGAGTNVKMGEFIVLRLPVVSTPFGARGLDFVDGQSGFVFERECLAPVLSRVCRLFAEDPARLRQVAENAYVRNKGVVDMDACVQDLVQAVTRHQSP